MSGLAKAEEREFVIQGELGLHARPAGRLASLASRYECEVMLARSDRAEEWVNARSVLSILSLAAAKGTCLRVRTQGVGCLEALEAVGRLLEESEEASAGV